MRSVGFLLLVSGILLVLAALLLLSSQGMRLAFAVSGALVQGLGMLLIAQHHRLEQRAP